jgi:hypothetical protein
MVAIIDIFIYISISWQQIVYKARFIETKMTNKFNFFILNFFY